MAVIVGTPAVASPLADGLTSTAHGLGRAPDGVTFYLECIHNSGEDDYDLGDRVYLIDNDNADWGYSANATHVNIQIHDSTPEVISNASTPAAGQFTANRWKAVAVPYLFDPTSVIGN